MFTWPLWSSSQCYDERQGLGLEGSRFTRALTHGLNSGWKESDELMYRIKLEIISSLSVTAGSPECSDLAGSCQDL